MIAERAERCSLASWHGLFEAGDRRDDPSPPQPSSWRALEALVALTMWTIAFKLILGL